MKANLFDVSLFPAPEDAVMFITNILESSTEYSIIGKDMNGLIVLWNEGARRLYGYEPEEVVGKMNAESLYVHEDVLLCKPRQILQAALQNGKYEGMVTRVRKNGAQFTARMVVTPRLDSSGKPIGYLLISKDISEELHMSAQLQINNSELQEQIAQRQSVERALLKSHEELQARASDLEQTAAQMKLMADMNHLLQACDNAEEASHVVQHILEQCFHEDCGTVYLTQPYGCLLERFAAWNGANLISKDSFETNECWGLRLGRSHLVDAGSPAPQCKHLEDRKEGSSICIPMLGNNQLLGVLVLGWDKNPSPEYSFRPEKREILGMAVADTIGLAISNLRLRDALKEQTIRDPLTRLYNRRYLEDSLNREISRARRSGVAVGVIMIDVDNFKNFNDSFGHPMGDQLLRSLGAYLKGCVRPEDIPSRYGGEEFTLILPGAVADIVRERAEKPRRGFRESPSAYMEGIAQMAEALSLSCGVAVFPEHGDSGAEILRAADDALYEAKRAGKNCVVVATKGRMVATRKQPILTA